MASSINAKTSGAGGVVTTADNSGVLDIQSGGTTVATVNSSGVDVTGNMSVNGNYLSSQPSFRNLIINGDMRIAQRGTSATGLTNGSGGYHTCDRWKFIESGSPTAVYTQTQDTDVPTGQGFATSLKMNCTTAEASVGAANAIYIGHILESQNLQHLKKGTASAESITISFWVKSNVTGTFVLGLQEFQNTRYNGKSYTIDAANTWEKKTLTFAGDTSGTLTNNNAAGLYVQFYLMAGTDYSSGTLPTNWETTVNANRAAGQTNLSSSTSNYINITGVQLEVGDTATPFEHRPYDVELARCQRYYVQYDYTGFYETIFTPTFISSANAEDVILYFPVEMRSGPNISHNGVGNFRVNVAGGLADEQCNGITASQISRQKARFAFSKPTSNMTIGQAGFINTQEGNDASIYISAEL